MSDSGIKQIGNRFVSLATTLKHYAKFGIENVSGVVSALRKVRVNRWLDGNRWWYLPAPAPNVHVSAEEALTYSGVTACIKAIAEPIAALPLREFEVAGGRRNALETDVGYLLNVQANPEMSAFDFKQAMLANAVFMGNGYAEIERDMAGRPIWLWPLESSRMTPERDAETRELVYRYSADGGTVYLRPDQVFHLKGLSFDGIAGLGLLHLAERSIALGIALETFGLTFFSNNAIPAGVLEAPQGVLNPKGADGKPDDKWIERMISDFYKVHGGVRQSNRIAYLPQGITYRPLTVPLDSAQFTVARKSQLEELARWSGVPLHRLGLMDRATWDNVEQENIQFVSYTIVQWVTRFEQEVAMKLYGRNLRGRRYIKFNVEGLLRGDIKSRFEAYSKGIMDGHITRNEVREREELDPLEYLDIPLTQVNLTTAERMASGILTVTEPEPEVEDEPEVEGEIEGEGETENDTESVEAPEARQVPEVHVNVGPFTFELAAAEAPQVRVVTAPVTVGGSTLNVEMPTTFAEKESAQVYVTAPINVEPAKAEVRVEVQPQAATAGPVYVNAPVNVEPAQVHVAVENPITVESAKTPDVYVTTGSTPVYIEMAEKASEVTVHNVVEAAAATPAEVRVEVQAAEAPQAQVQVVAPITVETAPTNVQVEVQAAEAPNVYVNAPVTVESAKSDVRVEVQAAEAPPAQVQVVAPITVEPAKAEVRVEVQAAEAAAPAPVYITAPVTVESPISNVQVDLQPQITEAPQVHLTMPEAPPVQVQVVAPVTVEPAKVEVQAAEVPVIEVHNHIAPTPVSVEAPQVTVEAAQAPDVYVQVGGRLDDDTVGD